MFTENDFRQRKVAAFQRAVMLLLTYRTDSNPAPLVALLTEAYEDNESASDTIVALIKLSSAIHNERPDDLEGWLQEILDNMVSDEADSL